MPFIIKLLQSTLLLGLLLLFIFIYFIHGNAHAKDLMIYTQDNVYYYSDVDRDNVVILPNDEIIDAEKLIELKENNGPFITREGVEIYKMEDNRFYVDDEFPESYSDED